MYEFREYLKTGKSKYSNAINNMLNEYQDEIVNNIELEKVSSCQVIFYLKNFNREAYIPVYKKKINIEQKTFKINQKHTLSKSFEDYKKNRFKIQLESWNHILDEIEKKYQYNVKQDYFKKRGTFKAFLSALGGVFGGGRIQKKLFLYSFFSEHFSFERGVFRNRNLESFSSKDSLLYIGKYSQYEFINRDSVEFRPFFYRKSTDFEKRYRKHPLLLNFLTSSINTYSSNFNQNNVPIKNIFKHHLRTLKDKNILRERMEYISFFKFNFFYKFKLRLPEKFLTDNTYHLFFLLTNNFMEDNMTKKNQHPLTFLSPEFDVFSYTYEELDNISWMYVNIILEKHNNIDTYFHDFMSFFELLKVNKKKALFLVSEIKNNRQKYRFTNFNYINQNIINHLLEKPSTPNYLIKICLETRKYNLSYLRELNLNSSIKIDDIQNIIKDKFKEEYKKNSNSDYSSIAFRNFYIKLQLNKVTFNNPSLLPLKSKDKFKEEFMINSLEQLFLISYYRNIINRLLIEEYEKLIFVYFDLVYFDLIQNKSKYRRGIPYYMRNSFNNLFVENLDRLFDMYDNLQSLTFDEKMRYIKEYISQNND